MIEYPQLRKRPGRRRQGGPGAGRVVVHLPHQRVDAVELQFLADEADEGDIECRAIEIAVEVEQEHLQQWRAVVESGTAAETGDAVETRLAAADPDRVDAVLEPAILVEPDIGGGIAEIAAAFLAMDHGSGHEPGAAEHPARLLDLSLR